MILFGFFMKFEFTVLVTSLWGGLHGFYGAWLRCNSLEWMVLIYLSKVYHFNDHSASLSLPPSLAPANFVYPDTSRLALDPQNRTLQPVQLRFLG